MKKQHISKKIKPFFFLFSVSFYIKIVEMFFFLIIKRKN